jgi:hypothetical protein
MFKHKLLHAWCSCLLYIYICCTCLSASVLLKVESQDVQNPISQRPSTRTSMLAIGQKPISPSTI